MAPAPDPPSRHTMLARQVRRLLAGAEGEPDGLGPFLDAVDAAYHQADAERGLLERSLELTSRELLEQNARLRAELAERTQIQERLQQELAHRRQAEESLRRSVVRLDEAQRVAQFGYWEVDLRSGSVFWSDQMYRIHGFEPGAVTPTVGLFARMVSPETIERIAAAVRETRDSGVRELVFSLRRGEGEQRTIRSSGEVIRNDEGRAVLLYGVSLDVTVDEERRAELIQAKERAEDMLRLKSAFLNNMSHEIRTPLTGILGFADVLLEEVTDETQREFVQLIARSGERLMDTLTSVLDLAQLQSGSFRLDPVPVDVCAEAEETLALLRPLAARKRVALTLGAAPPGSWALADRAALFRVLNNLIGNAVKFTDHGQVQVSVVPGALGDGSARPGVRLRVADSGPGIDPAFLPHLFDEFRQASDGYERAHEGNGLGLTITKRLVDLMGGAIRVASTPGVGTVFEVTLPRATSAQPVSQPVAP